MPGDRLLLELRRVLEAAELGQRHRHGLGMLRARHGVDQLRRDVGRHGAVAHGVLGRGREHARQGVGDARVGRMLRERGLEIAPRRGDVAAEDARGGEGQSRFGALGAEIDGLLLVPHRRHEVAATTVEDRQVLVRLDQIGVERDRALEALDRAGSVALFGQETSHLELRGA